MHRAELVEMRALTAFSHATHSKNWAIGRIGIVSRLSCFSDGKIELALVFALFDDFKTASSDPPQYLGPGKNAILSLRKCKIESFR